MNFPHNSCGARGYEVLASVERTWDPDQQGHNMSVKTALSALLTAVVTEENSPVKGEQDWKQHHLDHDVKNRHPLLQLGPVDGAVDGTTQKDGPFNMDRLEKLVRFAPLVLSVEESLRRNQLQPQLQPQPQLPTPTPIPTPTSTPTPSPTRTRTPTPTPTKSLAEFGAETLGDFVGREFDGGVLGFAMSFVPGAEVLEVLRAEAEASWAAPAKYGWTSCAVEDVGDGEISVGEKELWDVNWIRAAEERQDSGDAVERTHLLETYFHAEKVFLRHEPRFRDLMRGYETLVTRDRAHHHVIKHPTDFHTFYVG